MEKISCVCRSSIGQRVFTANAQRTFALHIYLTIIHLHFSTTQKVKGHHEWIQTSVWVELKAGGSSEGYYFYFISKAGFAGRAGRWYPLSNTHQVICILPAVQGTFLLLAFSSVNRHSNKYNHEKSKSKGKKCSKPNKLPKPALTLRVNNDVPVHTHLLLELCHLPVANMRHCWMLCWELCREVQCVRLVNFWDGLGWVGDSLRIYIYIVVFMQFVQAETKPCPYLQKCSPNPAGISDLVGVRISSHMFG